MSFFASVNAVLTQSKTFKPKRNVAVPSKQQHLRELAQNTLDCGGLAVAVRLPLGEDRNEWLAVHCVDFFAQINLLYGAVNVF